VASGEVRTSMAGAALLTPKEKQTAIKNSFILFTRYFE
jgi:hypothetical protein